MAKILTTAIVADIRNKLNGSVFSKNRYGSYVRTKVTPVNPQTTAQQNQRNRLATNSQAWRGLTEAQRQGWINAAPSFPITDIFGNQKVLSGNVLFVQLNNNLESAGAARLTAAPTPVEIPALSLVALESDAATQTLELEFDPAAVPAGFKICIQATGNIAPGINFVKNRFRTIGYLDPAAASPADISAMWATAHGALQEGMKVFVRAFMVSTTTGQKGIPVQVEAITA